MAGPVQGRAIRACHNVGNCQAGQQSLSWLAESWILTVLAMHLRHRVIGSIQYPAFGWVSIPPDNSGINRFGNPVNTNIPQRHIMSGAAGRGRISQCHGIGLETGKGFFDFRKIEGLNIFSSRIVRQSVGMSERGSDGAPATEREREAVMAPTRAHVYRAGAETGPVPLPHSERHGKPRKIILLTESRGLNREVERDLKQDVKREN